MGVNVSCLFEWRGCNQSLSQLPDFLAAHPDWGASNQGEPWYFQLEGYQSAQAVMEDYGSVYLEAAESPFNFLVGRQVACVEDTSGTRWLNFCQNNDNTRVNLLPLYKRIGRYFSASALLFVPDSSFPESKALDLIEQDLGLFEIEQYLIEQGSEHTSEMESLIVQTEQGWVSRGFYIEAL